MRGGRFVFGLMAVLATAGPCLGAGRPNVVLILADDLGYSDIGPFGGEIATPNLDRLAAGGLRLTRFYNGARCCPTRASLLTGLYAHQAGVGAMNDDTGRPGYRGHLVEECVTIAEVLPPGRLSDLPSRASGISAHPARSPAASTRRSPSAAG